MANYTIDININGDFEAGSTGGVAGSNATQTTPQATKNKNVKGLGTFVATQVAKPFINTAINTYVSNIELSTGSYALQQKANSVMQAVATGINIAGMAGAGLIIAGPFGAVIGGLVAIAQEGINYAGNVWQANLNKQIEDRQIQYLVNRMGPAYNGSRSGI